MKQKIVTYLKTYWQIILILILLVVIALLVKSLRNHKDTIAALQTKLDFNDSTSYSQITVWKDKYGEEHARAEDQSASAAAMKVYGDSVAKLLNIKSSQVTAMSKTITQLKFNAKLGVDTFWMPADNITVDSSSHQYIVSTDSTKAYRFHFNDSWMQVNGIIGDGKDSIHITGVDTLSRTDYTKRKWFLGTPHHYVDFTNANPYIKTSGYKGVTLKPDAYQWSVGPALGVGYYNFGSPKVWIGIVIQRSLIRF